MRISHWITGLLIMAVSTIISAQGIEFYGGTWEEAKAKALEEEKLIFVDAYAVWCGPCKKMAKTVFTDEAVGEYFNAQFVNMKIDMEKEMGRKFQQEYPVSAFPTLFFINEKGEVLKKAVGGRGVDDFLQLAIDIAGSYDRSGDLAKLYEEGDRSYEVVLKYVKALNNANKPSIKIANDYLREKKDLTKEERAEFLYEALTSSDSRLFTLFVEDLPSVVAIKGEQKVNKKIEEACWNTIETAIEFESPDLLDEAKQKMDTYLDENAQEFALTADYHFAKATANTALLNEAAMNMAKQLASDNAEQLHDICNEILQYKHLEPELVKSSEKIAKMAVDKSESPEYLLTYAKILAENSKNKKAKKAAIKALEMVPEGSKKHKEISEWMATLQ